MEHSSTSPTYELTDLQFQLWHLHLLSRRSSALTLSVRYRLRDIDPQRWCEAFSRVIEEEPLLSLRIAGESEEPLLVHGKLEAPAIVYEDCGKASAEEIRGRIEERSRFALDPRERLVDSLLIRESSGQYSWLLSVHHLIADGWAMKVIVERTLSNYQGAGQGNAGSATTEYACELTEYATSSAFEDDRSYWETKLSPHFLPLNFYDLIDGHFSHPIRLRLPVDPDLTAEIRKTSTLNGGGSGNPALAGFFASILALFLHKMTGERYLSIGVPYANRRSPERKAAVGLFMRVGVFRISLDPKENFSSLLARLLDEGRETARHLMYPLTNRGNRLYDVMLNVHNVSYGSVEGHPIEEEWLHSANDSLPFVLHVRTSNEDQLLLELDLQEERFPQDGRARILQQLLSLARQAVEMPHAPVSSFLLERLPNPFTTPWSRAGTAPRRLEQLFEQVLPSVSTTAAVFWGKNQISFGELNERAELICDALTKLGCEPGSIVGVYFRRSIGAVAALLGILKCGATWLPLDPEYPAELLRLMVDDASVRVGVAEEGAQPHFAQGRTSWVRLGAQSARIVNAPDYATVTADLRLLSDHTPEDLPAAAYCLYTSGSTGKPKGILGTHEGALNRLEWMWREYPLEPDEVLLQKTSLDFIDSVWEIFGALLSGHALVIADSSEVRDPLQLATLVSRHPVRRIILVPTLLRSLMETPRSFPNGLEKIARWFLTGELLTSEVARRFLELHPTAELFNLYGTTETYDAACTRVLPSDLRHTVVPIGRPIDNMELWVLDCELNSVAPGARGELYVRGIGVADGYFKGSDLSEAKFVYRSGDRSAEQLPLFRTGDAARILPDGRVQCIGRLDNMVKVGGYRVELEAIETAMRSLCGVEDGIVVAEATDTGETRLTAYVTGAPGARGGSAEIRRKLKEKLPTWMIPRIIEVDELPRTPSGKLKRLPVKPVEERDPAPLPPPSGVTANEARLLKIWQGLLKCSTLAVDDDFFEVGGTSLLAVRLASTIEREFKIQLPLSSVFEAPTVRSLAEKIPRTVPPRASSPVAVQIGSPTKIPLFTVPPAGSTVSAFGLLARGLPPDQSLYSFQPRGIEAGEWPHRSIEEMARAYVAEMKRVQPHGPYIVSGRCFGGYVAYEMAQRIVEAGERVAALIIIDSPEAPLIETEQRSHVGLRKIISYYPERMRYFLKKRMLTYTLWMKLRNETFYLTERLLTTLGIRLGDSRARRLKILRHIHTLAYHRYVARPYPGRITLFWANGLPDLTGEKEKWEKLAQGGVEWYTFSIRHHDLLKEQNVQSVAEQLASCMERAQQ